MINKLLNIVNQLLDLGKRNRLLNFKDSGLKSLKVLNKNIEEIFRGIKDSKEFPIFNVDPVLSKYNREERNSQNENDSLDFTDELVYEVASKQLGNRDILCYKKSYPLEKVLKALFKEFKFSITEKGINSLYLSFGFIKYTEDDIEYSAPLLLIPIELNNDEGYYMIREYEDEIILNPTLKYYFSSTYKIELVDYKDDALSTYFNKIRDILPDNIVLEEGMALGIYSFYKMNMYNDLMQNKDIVIKNNNIRALLGETIFEDEENLRAQPTYPVVNCDSSQFEAIQFAANGKSFCLQGPPGSGKSQTITNMIASLLGRGKKVLFVSEKIAALKVVYENLRRAGLSDFAIELHSNKANKKEFIENLYKTATLPKYDIDFKTRFLGAEYESLKINIKDYEYELHSSIPMYGVNLLDLYSMYLSIKANPLSMRLELEDFNLFDMDRVATLLDQYGSHSEVIGYDYRRSALYQLNEVTEDYIMYGLSDDLDTSISHVSKIKGLCEIINKYSSLELNCITDIYKNIILIDKLARLVSFHPNYFNKRIRTRAIDMIEQYQTLNKTLDMKVFDLYNQSIIQEDLEGLYNTLKDSGGLFKGKEYKEAGAKILSYRKDKAKVNEILPEVERLAKFKKNLYAANALGNDISKLFGNVKSSSFKQIIFDLKSLEGIIDMDLSQDGYEAIRDYYVENIISLNEFRREGEKLAKLNKMFNPAVFNIFKEPFDSLLSKFKGIDEEKIHFERYQQLNECIAELKEYNVLDYLHAFLDEKREISLVAIEFKKLFLHQIVFDIISSSPLLSQFKSLEEDEIIEQFRELDEMLLTINRDFIISENSQKRKDTQNLIEGSEFKLLAREHEKLRRQLPIRVLLEQIFELALDVKPVFLMSPLSVSTYLACKLNMFDCVIFDEASQIFASDALGAIYRAQQCIVIGDTKQLPPTSFFQAGSDDENKEYDLESILDKASQTFKTSSLKWHYRSRSEELITFSNQSFYDSNLITIPQARNHESGFGIDFHYVENGRYDTNSRTNPIEANAVCDMVFEHFKNSTESLGVVAFSNVQAELIANLVEKRLKKHPEFQKFFDDSLDEPFFVKNLESVQGDERDRIIFSICYGFNQDNKFYQRFGPLNNSGGERRLNVAITRAKYNITVVSSIQYSDIKDTESLGVMLLKSYLSFAQNVTTNKNYAASNNGIINSVKEYLESLGYSVLPHYGSSSFKVDLAVKKDNDFVLAIMIDGKSKYSSNLTDKYRLEKLLLERLGWRYFKLYSTSWVNNIEQEKERLYQFLNSNETIEKEKKYKKVQSYLKIDKSDTSFEALFDEYQYLDIDYTKEYYEAYGLEYIVKETIKLESPIHEDYLIKKIAQVLDAPKITSSLREEIIGCIPDSVYKVDDFYFNDLFMEVKFRINATREIPYIHPDEFIDAVYEIVKHSNGISIDGCYRTIMSLVGQDKITPNAKKLLNEATERLLSERKIFQKKDNLYIDEKK